MYVFTFLSCIHFVSYMQREYVIGLCYVVVEKEFLCRRIVFSGKARSFPFNIRARQKQKHRSIMKLKYV